MAKIIDFQEYRRKKIIKEYFEKRKKALKTIKELSDAMSEKEQEKAKETK